ncbi:MAG: hypothetical protein Q8Q95_04175 [bacterium]|nr:hypothetical protein [bacterium]
MGRVLEWLKLKGKEENLDPLRPLEDFFEESKRELELLRLKPRVKKKAIVVSYNITQIIIAIIVCIFLTGVLTAYHFFPDYLGSNISTIAVGKDSSDLKTETESPEAERVRKLRESIRGKKK